jgi:hypothetical protein
MNKIIPAFIQNFPQLEETKIIEEIIDYIERKDWNSARQNWYSKIMKNDLTNINLVDFYGEIQEYFMKDIYNFQTHSLIQICTENCIYNGNMILSEKSSIVEFGRLKDKTIAVVSSDFSFCTICKAKITCNIRFKYKSLFVFINNL